MCFQHMTFLAQKWFPHKFNLIQISFFHCCPKKENIRPFEQFISEYFISFFAKDLLKMQSQWARSSAWIERLPSKFNKESRKSRDRSPPGPCLYCGMNTDFQIDNNHHSYSSFLYYLDIR